MGSSHIFNAKYEEAVEQLNKIYSNAKLILFYL